MMKKIWTGKRGLVGYTGYEYEYEPTLMCDRDIFYTQKRYIGWEYTAPWWRRMFLHDNSGHEIEMQIETEKIEKNTVIAYMANHGSTLEDAIQIMENL